MEHKYQWQEVFDQITAADLKIVASRINHAEALLTLRLQALAHSPNNDLEKRALQQSIEELGRIQIEKLGYPDWRN